MLVALTKFGTTDTVGQFAFAIALTAPVFMFACLDLREVQVTDTHRQFTQGDYIALRLVSTGIGYLAVILLALILDYHGQVRLLILLVGLAKASEIISDIFYGVLQKYERMERIAKSMILRGGLSLGAMTIVLAVTGNVTWAVAGMPAAWIAVLLLYDIPNTAQVIGAFEPTRKGVLQPRWHLNTMRQLTRIALPLGVMMLLVALSTNIPRYFLEHAWGEAELGIFAALSYAMIAGRTVTIALGQATVPRLAEYYATNRLAAFHKLLLKSVGIGVILGVLGVAASLLVGKPVLELVYTAEYAQHVDVLTWVMCAAGVRYVEGLLGYGLTATRFFAIKLPLAIFNIVCVVGLSIVLIPSAGIRGAAWVMVSAAFMKLLVTAAALIYIIRKDRASQNTIKSAASRLFLD